MAISFVNASAYISGSGSFSVSTPSGYAYRDLLILTCITSTAINNPSGWNLLTFRQTTGTVRYVYVFYKFAGLTGTEAATTTISATGCGVMTAYRGVSTIDELYTQSSGTATRANTVTFNTKYDNDYVVSFFGIASGTAINWTNTPTGTTNRSNTAATTGAAVNGILIVDESQAITGTTTLRQASMSASGVWSSIAFAMAPARTLYWVGGSGTWSRFSNTNWAITSGGTGGYIPPFSTDNVIIDTNSGTGVISFSSQQTTPGSVSPNNSLCGNLTVTATQDLTLGNSNSYLTVYGSLTFPDSPGSFSANANSWVLNFTSNSTTTNNIVTTNNYGLSSVNFYSIVNLPGKWILGSDLIAWPKNGKFFGLYPNLGFSTNPGTLDTTNNNYSLTFGNFSGTPSANLYLNGSTVNVYNSFSVGSTINIFPGTSTIYLNGSYSAFGGGQGREFNNVIFANTSIDYISNKQLAGNNNIKNLTIIGPDSPGYKLIFVTGHQMISGNLICAGSNGNQRIIMQGYYGVPYTNRATISVAGNVDLTDTDFIDINANNIPFTGTRISNTGLSCINVISSTPKNVYCVTSSTNNVWYDNIWSSTQGGVADTLFTPLPQDVVIIDETCPTNQLNNNVTVYGPTIDMSNRTSPFTLNLDSSIVCCGDWINGSGTIMTGNSTIYFTKRYGTSTITSAGKNFTQSIMPYTFGGSVKLIDDLTTTYNESSALLGAGLELYSGNLDLNDKTFTANTIRMASGYDTSISFGTNGKIIVNNSSGGVIYYTNFNAVNAPQPPGNFTFTGTSNVTINNQNSAFTIVSVGAGSSNSLSISITNQPRSVQFNLGSPGNLTRIRDLNLTNFNGLLVHSSPIIYGNLIFSSAVTFSTSANFILSGNSNPNSIISNGLLNIPPLIINGNQGSYTIQDEYYGGSTTGYLSLQSGASLYVNNGVGVHIANLSYYYTGSGTSNLDLGTSTIYLTNSGSGINTWNIPVATGLTLSANDSTINVVPYTTGTVGFVGGGLNYGTLNFGQTSSSATTYTYNIKGNNSFITLSSNRPYSSNIIFDGDSLTNITNWNISGVPGNRIYVKSTGLTTATANINGPANTFQSADWLYVDSVDVTPAPNGNGTQPYYWYFGDNSINGNTESIAFMSSDYRAYILQSGTTWTVPNDWNSTNNIIYMIGGGGAGNSATTLATANRAGGGGGGGGGFTLITNQSYTPGSSISYAIGAGGSSSGQTSFSGNPGGNTTWNSAEYSANGGGGGYLGLRGIASPGNFRSFGGYGGQGLTYRGGFGGNGAFATAASTGVGGGGGGGAAGPLGNGANGGIGFASTTASQIAAGGGGGNGGGSNAGNAAATNGGLGGNNASGVGRGTGGTTGSSGFLGGGGGGSTAAAIGGYGSGGLDIRNTLGSGGADSGGTGANKTTVVTGAYGAGGGGGGSGTGSTMYSGTSGQQGVIFIVYTPAAASSGNFFLMFI